MTTARDVPRQGPTSEVAPDAVDEAGARPAPVEESRPPLDLMKFITSIGSPIALATALLFYFGWVRSEEQARAFGADASVFAMSTQDYVLRSVNVLFFPLILMLLVGLLVLRLDRMLRGPRPPRWLEPLARALRLSWIVFLPLGFVLYAAAGRPGDVTLPFWVGLSVVAPAYGTTLGRRATGDPGRFSRVALGLLAALVTVILFWQTERLASLGGEALAQDIKDNIANRLTRVELFSLTNLHLDGPGVTTSQIGAVEGEYNYRYSGLFLLQRSGEKYFLLTDGWDRDEGRLVVVPDSDSIRVEFGR